MPARRLTNSVPCGKYDVVGIDSDAATHFIRHVGMVSMELGRIRAADPVSLVHMKPPLERELLEHCISAVGTANLTADEINKTSVFIDELIGEYETRRVRGFAQYVVFPHVRECREQDGTIVSRQYSCTGFVIEAYREVLIDLLDTKDARLPGVPLETIVRAYPDQERSLRNPDRRARVGLRGDGPWPVVLPGYVLNSLVREEDEIRRSAHVARPGDEYFPSKRDRENTRNNA